MQSHSLRFAFADGVAYCGVKQRGVGGARAAEEAVLRDQILVGIHSVLHVLPADQAAEQFVVRGGRQVHAVVTLKAKQSSFNRPCAVNDQGIRIKLQPGEEETQSYLNDQIT